METILYCWATLLIEQHAEALISGLVRRGMTVQPLSSNGRVIWVGEVNVLCALEIRSKRTFSKDELRTTWLMEHVKAVLEEHKVGYFSLVVSNPLDQTCTWTGPNIKPPEQAKGPTSPSTQPAPLPIINSLDDALDDA